MKTTIVGMGGFGTALAYVASKKSSIQCIVHSEKTIIDLEKGINTKYYGERKIFKNKINLSTDYSQIKLFNPDLLILSIPSTILVNEFRKMLMYIPSKTIVLVATKGFDPNTHKTFDEILSKLKKSKITFISGPSFASEIIEDKITYANILTKNKKYFNLINKILGNKSFKLSLWHDIHGGEICGAIKNVYAIACGYFLTKNKNSKNYSAAFFNLCFLEITEIIKKLKCNIATLSQFCGLGDLFLTCTNDKSRNFCLGKFLATYSKKFNINSYHDTVEGYYAFKSISKMLDIRKFPIIYSLKKLLNC